jgi:hypothetical protein
MRHRLRQLEQRLGRLRPDPHQAVILHVPRTVPSREHSAWAAEQVLPCRCADAACPGPPLILLPEKLTSEQGAYREDAHHGA